MHKLSWKQLATLIPNKVQVGRKVFYDVLWYKNQEDYVGLSVPDKKEIRLALIKDPKETTKTYLHELLHAVSDTHDIGLTEQQVSKLESSFYYLLKDNNVFNKRGVI